MTTTTTTDRDAPKATRARHTVRWPGLRSPTRWWPRYATLLLAATVLVLTTVQECRASIVLRVGDAQVTEGESGYVDVFFELENGQYNLAAYAICLRLFENPAGVRFTGAELPPNSLLPGEFFDSTVTDHTVCADDLLLFAGFDVPITDGSVLLRLLFQTDLGSVGTYAVAVNQDLLATNFSDGFGDLLFVDDSLNWVGIRFEPGTMTVNAIPEPTALLAWLLFAPAAWLLARRSRQRQRAFS